MDIGSVKSEAEAMNAMQKYSEWFEKLPEEYKENKNVVLVAVANDTQLNYVPFRFHDDEEVVRAAVSKWGRNLKFVSERLRKSKEIVLLAVKQDGCALEFANNYNGNKQIVYHALKQTLAAAKYADKSLLDKYFTAVRK